MQTITVLALILFSLYASVKTAYIGGLPFRLPNGPNILTRMFCLEVLELMDYDKLLTLYDCEANGFTVIPDRREDVKIAFDTQTGRLTPEDLTSFLIFAYVDRYPVAYEFMLTKIPSFSEIIEIAKSKDAPEDFINDLEVRKLIDEEYIMTKREDFDYDPFEFNHLSPGERLPAAFRKFLDVSVEDSELDSQYLSERFVGKYGLYAAFIMYQVEMMDPSHTHDTDQVISKYLNRELLFIKNDIMANFAKEMFLKSCWSSLKLIIDAKFSFNSFLSQPIWFKDLDYLINYGKRNSFPAEFEYKVIELASDSALSRLLRVNPSHPILSELKEDDEDVETIKFNI